VGGAVSRLAWCAVHALELHVVAALLLIPPSRGPVPREEPFASSIAVDREPEPPPLPATTGEGSTPAPRRARFPGRPGAGKPRPGGSPPTLASSAVAAPVGDPLPVASAPSWPGGPTATVGGVGAGYGDGNGGGQGLVDLSLPARLAGSQSWPCEVSGDVPNRSFVRVRALVRPDATAERVEVLDGGQVQGEIEAAAEPCVLRGRFVPGRDRAGALATRWTVPFRIVVVGVVR